MGQFDTGLENGQLRAIFWQCKHAARNARRWSAQQVGLTGKSSMGAAQNCPGLNGPAGPSSVRSCRRLRSLM